MLNGLNFEDQEFDILIETLLDGITTTKIKYFIIPKDWINLLIKNNYHYLKRLQKTLSGLIGITYNFKNYSDDSKTLEINYKKR